MIITHLLLQWLQYFWAWVAQIWIAKDIWSLSSYTQCIFNATKIYHINYGVIQGFPALRKAVTTHMKKYDFFFVFDIGNQLLARQLSFAPLGQVDEWMEKPLSFSIHGHMSEFFWLWLLKQWKISLLVFTCQLSSYGKHSKRNSIFTRSPCIILYLTYFTFWNVTQSSCNNTEKASA